MLVTGATGNIGTEVIHYLTKLKVEVEIIAAVRNIEKAQRTFQHPGISFVSFDFESPESFREAFKEIDVLFLLRPPHISQVEKVFRPLLEAAKRYGIKNVVFLSVQGVEKSKVIPHNKIERLIQSLNFDYIFVRPGYFMQNLTTTLLPEIRDQHSIILPSGNAKFNWVDVKNIGEATAKLITQFETYKNQAYEITGTENLDFSTVAHLLSEISEVPIKYRSINPIRFYFKKKKEGVKSGFAAVMTILHFLPRLQSEPEISDSFEKITGKKPTTLSFFIKREKDTFIGQS